MPLAHRCTRIAVTLAFGALLVLPLAAARDLAEVMPKDTALYAGWSQHAPADDPELAYTRKLLQNMKEYLPDDEEGRQITEALFDLYGDIVLMLQNASGAFGVFDVQVAGDQPDVQAALVLAVGEQNARDLVTRVAATLGELGAESPATVTVKDVACRASPLGDSPFTLVWAAHEDLFIAALGQTAMEKVLATAAGDLAPLSGHPELIYCREKAGAKPGPNSFDLFVDAPRIVTRAKEIARQVLGELPPQLDPALEQLGINAVRSKYLVLTKEDADAPQRFSAFAHIDGELKGLLSLWNQKPLENADLELIPQDAYWAQVWNLDLLAVWRETLRVTEALAPDARPMVEGSVAMVTPMLGFSIPDQILPAFGDTWAVFDAPSHGGVLLTGTTLVADVRDPNVVQGLLARIVQIATPFAAQEDVKLKIRTTTHGGHEIHYLMVGPLPSPVAPAWGFVNDRVVFGLWPQTVAAALEQVDPKTRKSHLLARKDVQELRRKLPEEIIAFGYVDMKYVTRLFYPLINAAQTMVVSMVDPDADVGIDLAVMPPANELVARVHNYVGTTAVGPDGVRIESIGDAAGLAIPAVAGAAFGASIMVPSFARAQEVAERTVSAQNLKSVGLACMIYANEHDGRFPESFEQLLEAGYITRRALVAPASGAAPESGEVSYVLVAAGAAQDEFDARHVLAYEKRHTPEGTNVLFGDGHIEWMTWEQFTPLLEETKQSLRGDEKLELEN